MEWSNCCYSPRLHEDTDICSSCKEHADFFDSEADMLEVERNNGKLYARQLVMHLLRMSAAELSIPLNHQGVNYTIQVNLLDREHCMCPACKDGDTHDSDCAVHNMPAYPNENCDCK